MKILPVILAAAACLGSARATTRAHDAATQPVLSGTNGDLKPNLQLTNKPPEQTSAAITGQQPEPGKDVVPVQDRPFTLTLQRAHLFGDWGGLLPALQKLGITPSLTYESDSGGNPFGGRKQGISYDDNIGIGFVFDLEKIISLNGGSFQVTMSQRDGDSLSQKYVGNAFTIQQVYGGQTFHLIDAEYQQKLFDDHVELSIGRVAAGDDFFVCAYDYLFMQNGFDGNPVGVFFNAPGMTAYPNATWGARIKVIPTGRTYIMAGIYNGDSTIRTNYKRGADLSFDGPIFAIAEVVYLNNGLPGDSQYLGDYKLGSWYDDDLYTNYETVGLSTPSAMRRGNWGVYGLFDQVILPFAQPGSNRGLGVFGSALLSPDQSVSQLPWFFTAGFACRGLSDIRPRDIFGFGAIYGQFSNDLTGAQEREQILIPSPNPAPGIQSHECVLELTYRFSMRDGGLFIQPDLQYIIRPGGTGAYSNALVIGAQAGINF